MWTLIFWIIFGIIVFLGLIVLASAALGIKFVEEGTAIAVVRFSGFRKFIMAWKDHKLNPQWDVEDAAGYQRAFGGLCWIGFWPIDKVYKYDFRWRDIQLVKGEEKAEFHDENIGYIFVRPDVYWTDIKAAETGKPERIPLDVQFLVTMRVCNPYKALFKAPSNWNENSMTRLNAKFRGWVGEKTLDDVLSLKEDPEQIWNELKNNPLIKTLENEWGIKIEENGIEIRDVGLPSEYQTAAAAEKKQKLEAAGFAASTAGAELSMISSMVGIPIEDLQKDLQKGVQEAIKADPVNGLENWLKAHPKYWDLIQKKQLGIRPILFGNADGSPLDPVTAALAALISVAKGAAGGAGGSSKAPGPPPPVSPRTP